MFTVTMPSWNFLCGCFLCALLLRSMEEPEHLSIFLRDISREWSSISGTAFVELLAIEQRERIGGGGGKPFLQNKEETTGILKKTRLSPLLIPSHLNLQNSLLKELQKSQTHREEKDTETLRGGRWSKGQKRKVLSLERVCTSHLKASHRRPCTTFLEFPILSDWIIPRSSTIREQCTTSVLVWSFLWHGENKI